MEIYLIQSLNDLINANEDAWQYAEFEIRMPSQMQIQYMPRDEYDDLTELLEEMTVVGADQGYDVHEWYDFHLQETIYEFTKEN